MCIEADLAGKDLLMTIDKRESRDRRFKHTRRDAAKLVERGACAPFLKAQSSQLFQAILSFAGIGKPDMSMCP